MFCLWKVRHDWLPSFFPSPFYLPALSLSNHLLISFLLNHCMDFFIYLFFLWRAPFTYLKGLYCACRLWMGLTLAVSVSFLFIFLLVIHIGLFEAHPPMLMCSVSDAFLWCKYSNLLCIALLFNPLSRSVIRRGTIAITQLDIPILHFNSVFFI